MIPVPKVEVLLVEDNVGDALLVQQIAAECAVPVRVHIAIDGEQAIEMLSASYLKLDLIILDLNIPKISGLVFLERYRGREVPIVVFSSSQNPVDINRALALGAREFVSKPLDFESFFEAVRAIIDKWTTAGCDRR